MKRALVLAVILISAAGFVYLQTNAPAPPGLATLMPSGALLVLESPDFSRLLRDWDESTVKTNWLASDNFAVFSRSNLYTKLAEVYGQYGTAAGLEPGIAGLREISGTDSALALYGIRDVEFLYLTRVGESALLKSQLWAVRDKFERREAGGVQFYLRSDPESHRTVAFAFTKGLLLLATRDDLVAQSLELLAGAANPSIAADRWYRDATAAASSSGDLRLVMNLETLVRSTYFRSYWVQRNVSAIRPFWAGISDLQRSRSAFSESRIFLRSEATAQPAGISDLMALVPPEAGLYKASPVTDASVTAALVVQKLIGPKIQTTPDYRRAPMEVTPDARAGTEADLETRINEQPLPADAGITESIAAVRSLIEKAGAGGMLLLHASSTESAPFVSIGTVIVLSSSADWNPDSVRAALASAAGKLWTTSQLGTSWTGGTAGRHAIERIDGLGTLMFANRGRLLFLANDPRLLAAALDRVGTSALGGVVTYAAGVRHQREQAAYDRLMGALDYGHPSNIPAFFSDNLGSLSHVLANITEVGMTEEDGGAQTRQTIIYRLAP